jgi:signal transduction histidine kinase
MNDYLIPLHILLATAAMAMVFVLVVSTSPSDRTTTYYIFLSSLVCTFLAYTGRGSLLAFDIVEINEELARTRVSGSPLIVVMSIVIGIAIFLRIMLIKSLLGKSIAWGRELIVFIVILILSIGPTYLSGRSIDDLIRYSTATIFYLICAGITVFILHKVHKQPGMLLGRLVYLISIFIVLINAVALVVLLFMLPGIDAEGTRFINLADLWLRGIRISLSFCIDIALLYYWLQNHSTEALRAADGRIRLQALLEEKEILVHNLLDADALTHTGALAGGLSHELNQFLARIQLDAESAKSYVLANQSPDRIISILNRLTQANQEAAKLIGSLKRLFVKRAEERTLCELDTLVETVVSLYASRIKQSGIDFECHAQTGAKAMLDDGLIRRVISNLLANALDACNATGRNDLQVRVTSQIESGSWVFTVSDNAMGVDASVMHKVFSLFATTKSEGTGVGLWLSQHIVEIHAGSIRFENLDAGGVKFSFQIPLA